MTVRCEVDHGPADKPTPPLMVHQWYGRGSDKGCRDVPDIQRGQADPALLPHVVKWTHLCPSCGYRPWNNPGQRSAALYISDMEETCPLSP